MVDENGTTRNERRQYYENNEVQEFDCNNDEEYYVVVENMPVLLGGITELQKKIVYPARGSGMEGRVVVQFIVDKSGSSQCHEITKSLAEFFDQEAIRVVKESRFRPGLQNGKPIAVQYSLPIVFRQ